MSDFESAVREMLRERATDVRTTPDWLDDLDVALPRRARGQLRDGRIGKALLVAAVILLVAALNVGIVHVLNRHRPPSVTHPKPLPTEQRSYCPATLPSSCPRTARAVVPVADGSVLLAVTPDGAIVDRYDGKTRDVVLAGPGSVKRLLTIRDRRADEAITGSINGKWAAITIAQYP